MSVSNILLGEDCGVDIYEEPNEDKWVECKVRQSKIRLYIAIPIVILVVLLFVWFGSPSSKFGAILVGGLVITGMAISTFYLTPKAARIEHKRFQKELSSYTDRGMSQDQAIAELKKERLEREHIAATQRAAQTQASATLTGLGAVASALKSRS